MDFQSRHIVVTGGAGALGTAVVSGLIEAGAVCHVPCFDEAEAKRFALRDSKQVVTTVAGDLSDEAVVGRVYQGIAPLWASIQIAGGFAAGPLAQTAVATIRQQIDMNLVSCMLCCRAAVQAMAGSGGRIVNVAARPRKSSRMESWSMRLRLRPWIRRPTGMPCPRLTSRSGRRWKR
jgi:NAD(P)-dependent dehydrogenase (short-subunit alcohol dehydrogenase family)